jgi:hypothetical protein
MANNIDENLIIKVCEESVSMNEAAKTLGLAFSSFKRYATRLGCYKTNQGLTGTKKHKCYSISIEDIFSNKVPFQSNKLRKRLFAEGYKEEICECCKRSEWLGEKIPLELHHKDGDKMNNDLDNLEIVCPNCHTFTETYKGKNIKK